VIVRIANEGQYEVAEGDTARLQQLDDAAVAACEAGQEERFHQAFDALLAFVRSSGTAVSGDELLESDMILPPADTSFEEARAEFTGEGLLPNT
jgi:hypothetical protein